MSFSAIACVGKNGELGQDNQLLFHLPEDMAFFKQTTMGHPVLMGRKTWESIGHPLPGRRNFVVSRDPSLTLPEGVELVSDLSKFIAENSGSKEEIFVIGGANLYAQLLPFCRTLYLTEVSASAPGADAFFPDFQRGSFLRKSLGQGAKDNLQYEFVKYERKPL